MVAAAVVIDVAIGGRNMFAEGPGGITTELIGLYFNFNPVMSGIIAGSDGCDCVPIDVHEVVVGIG